MRQTTFVLALTTLAAAAPAASQNLFVTPTPEKGVWLESSYTSFDTSLEDLDFEVDFTSTILYLGGRLPINPTMSLIADLPIAHGSVGFDGESESNTIIGNPLVGAEYAATPQVTLALSTRLPLTNSSFEDDDVATATSFLSDPLRLESFAMDYVPVSLAARYAHPISEQFSLLGRAGITQLFFTGDEDEEGFESENETLADYGFAGLYSTGDARFSAGLQGRWNVSADEGDFGENSLHEIGAGADILFRGVRPGVTLRYALDEDVREVRDFSFGLTLQIPLR
jgi:hypothetical protein